MFERKRWVGCGLAILVVFASACAPPTESGASGSSKASQGGGSGEVVARVGDRSITMAEIDDAALKANMKVYQQLYDARKNAANAIIDEQILEAESAKRGVSIEDLMRNEVEARSGSVSDEEIEAWYNQNKARVGNRAIAEVKNSIQQFLTNQKRQSAQSDFLRELRKDAGVNIDLTPPRVEIAVAANEPYKGKQGAPITIVEYSEFQ